MIGQGFKRRLLVATSLLTLLAMPDMAASAAARDRTIGVILTGLPQRSDAAFEKLLASAGKPRREFLEMTNGEKWSIDARHWHQFSRAAARLGVKFTKLDASWNQAMRPMQHSRGMSATQSRMMHDLMSSKAATGMSMMQLPDPAVEEYALTKDMHENLAPAAQPELVIALTETLSVTARRTQIVKTANGYAWHGAVTETGEPVTLLWWPSGKLTGRASYRGQIYAIHNLGGGMHGIVKMDPNALPEDHAPMSRELRQKMHMQMDPLVTKGDASLLMPGAEGEAMPATGMDKDVNARDRRDAGPATLAFNIPNVTAITPSTAKGLEAQVTIRVLVAYTAGAAKHYEDIETDLIALAIEDANQSFRTSGIGNVQLELAYAYQTTYVESGTHFEHVFRFADNNDGYMDEVHGLRDRYAADVAILVVDDANGCGLAAEVHARAERAFGVVHHECAANTYSLPHEIGHLIGARHDEALDDSPMPFAFGHGYVHGNAWRTMMSYKDSCGGCIRLPIWSNPAVLVHGEPAGDEQSNNARVIAEQAARVAAFR